MATFIRTVIFLVLAGLTFKTLGAFGLALADSITVTVEVLILIYYLRQYLPNLLMGLGSSSLRFGGGLIVSILVVLAVLYFIPLPNLPKAFLAIFLATIIYLPFIKKELWLILKL